MAPSFGDYVLLGVVAAVVTFVTTPIVGRLARARGWVYEPNERSVHTSPIPHVGGLAMLAGLLVAFIVAMSLDRFDAIFADNSEPIGIVIAALVVFVTGLLDDIRDMAPPGKVTGVVLAGVVLSWFGATMLNFRVPFYDVVILSADWIPLFTVLWLLGMTQAINLIDGLDGLAAGIVGIGALAFFLYANRLNELALLSDRNAGPMIAIITAGVCLGFLPHNFNPARIFMGDSGAFLLGLLMAVSTSLVGGRADPNTQAFVGQTYFFFAPLAIPVLILGVPILDTVFAIVRRASKRQALDVADKGHLHHRLMNLGHGHRRSVLILWTWTALLSAFVLYPVLTDDNPRYLPFGIGALAIVLFTVLHPSVRRRRAMEVEAALERPASEQIDPSRPERQEQYSGGSYGGGFPPRRSRRAEIVDGDATEPQADAVDGDAAADREPSAAPLVPEADGAESDRAPAAGPPPSPGPEADGDEPDRAAATGSPTPPVEPVAEKPDEAGSEELPRVEPVE